MLNALRKITLAAALIGTSFVASSAHAGGYGYVAPIAPSCHTTICQYKTVTVWVTKHVQRVKQVAYYTDCGLLAYRPVIYTDVIQVPVTKIVKVCH